MIKLVLPLSKKDFKLATLFALRIKKFDDMKERDILVVVTWSDQFGVPEYCEFLRPFFKSVDLHITTDVPEDLGWPEAANHMFYEAAKFLDRYGNESPWMWLEADCVLLVPH